MGIRSLNNLNSAFLDTFFRSGRDTPPFVLSGLNATGGVISDYADPGPGAIYRAHIFTSSGTFQVNSIGNYGSDVEYLVVAGGGAGGNAAVNGLYNSGGGGGAGGFRTNVYGHPLSGSPFSVSTSPGSYTVIVGAGGNSVPVTSTPTFAAAGGNGSPSAFGAIISNGGGGGATGFYMSSPTQAAQSGGSGGGQGTYAYMISLGGSLGQGNTPPSSPPQGNPGGLEPGGGGGGAGSAGSVGHGGSGGIGTSISITGIVTHFAGGGGGGSYPGTGGLGGLGGGGNGGASGNISPGNTSGQSGTHATGGGGGGMGADQSLGGGSSGSGGSGIVVVRYQIGQLAAAKASGGSISYYNGKTIHTFTNSGTFTTPASFNQTIEYVVVGGGGGGGGGNGNAYTGGGGGGAGNYKTGLLDLVGPSSITITIGSGGKRGEGTLLGSISSGSPGGTTSVGQNAYTGASNYLDTALDGVFGNSVYTDVAYTATFTTPIPYNTLTIVYGNMANGSLGNPTTGAVLSINGSAVSATGVYGTAPYSSSYAKYYSTTTPGTLTSLGMSAGVSGSHQSGIFEIYVNGSLLSPIISISAAGGAGGGHGASAGLSNGQGSGGGGAYNNLPGGTTTGSPFPGVINSTPVSGWAHVGAAGGSGSGGGGGAGSAGASGPNPYGGGAGGAGIQIPATFRNPISSVGAAGTTLPSVSGADTSGKYWVAGGGGAGFIQNFGTIQGTGGGVGSSGGPYAGAGPGSPVYTTPGGNALENTGSGGGGGTRGYPTPDASSPGGNGGSGIVLIAYPS